VGPEVNGFRQTERGEAEGEMKATVSMSAAGTQLAVQHGPEEGMLTPTPRGGKEGKLKKIIPCDSVLVTRPPSWGGGAARR